MTTPATPDSTLGARIFEGLISSTIDEVVTVMLAVTRSRTGAECATCGHPTLRPTAHADWCGRVRDAAPDFVTARYRAAVIAEAEARAARRVAS